MIILYRDLKFNYRFVNIFYDIGGLNDYRKATGWHACNGSAREDD